MIISCGGNMKSIKKEDIKDLSYKDITNIILENKKGGMNTLDLFTMIVDLLELPKSTIDTKIADYYTSLTTDKRFLLVDGLWDLRSRHTSDKILVDATEEELEDEEEFDESEEMEEEIEEDVYEDDIDGDTSYDEDDDGLGDLVVLDEDEIDLENN
jgi:DNA-directed RNA polymerase delta subunit